MRKLYFMENYIVSARKYRPTTFDSVVGQENITQTLRNAIRSNHLAHAYLFCGPRGVGKTTCARIFAKTINCLNPTSDHEACNECESCKAFNEQRSMNIHELDAASNNSVEDIRQLMDQVRIPPQIGKYSVFIIDEVHMLSQAAFNAFLKTLEEPPSYAIFILATTEKHKVLPTILSRCQVYDFSRITVADTIHHLQYVAHKEGIKATEEALGVVAQKADGGMRDALSIFDQLVSFCGSTITYEQAIEVLNVLDTEYYFRLVDCALQNDYSQALLLLNNILNKGFDLQNFISGLGIHLRNLLVSKDSITTQLLETSENIRKHYAEQAKRCAAIFLIKALNIENECDIQYRTTKNKRLTVEIMLIKLCQLTLPEESVASTPLKSTNANPANVPPTINKGSAPKASTTNNVMSANSGTPKVANSVSEVNSTPQPQKAVFTQPSQKMPQATSAPAFSVSIHVPNAEQTAVSQPTNTQQTDAASQPKRERPFSNETFDEAWLTLPRLFADDDRLRATLINAKAVAEGTNIILTLSNPLQEQQILQVKEQIIKELSNKLENDNITLKCKIEEHQQHSFTLADRYKNLSAKNKEIEHLREVMDMQME